MLSTPGDTNQRVAPVQYVSLRLSLSLRLRPRQYVENNLFLLGRAWLGKDSLNNAKRPCDLSKEQEQHSQTHDFPIDFDLTCHP